MPSKTDLRRWGAAGGRASYSSVTDPEERARLLRERSAKATAARNAKYPPKYLDRPRYIPHGDFAPVSIPADAFRFTDSDGEWETIEGDEE